ncbi:MAG: HDOD domain-containing protein [Magnetococcus sp. WYHC-3]
MGAPRKPELGDLDDLSPLPETCHAIQHLGNRLSTPPGDIIVVIQEDPVLTLSILRACNTPQMGFARRLGSVQQAVVWMGYNAIKNMAVDRTRVCDKPAPDAAMQAQVHHARRVAALCRTLAQRLELPPGEFPALQSAGLLHDMGRLLMVGTAPVAHARAVARAKQHTLSLTQAEQEVFGVDHARLGGRCAARWFLPPFLERAASRHHPASRRRGQGSVEEIVAVANALAHFPHATPPLPPGVTGRFGLSLEQLAETLNITAARQDPPPQENTP